MQKLKTAAIIGRTNVGKSTLFNCLTESVKAITSNQPGTTRDRNEANVNWRGLQFKLIDTGGLDIDPASEIERQIINQIDYAISLADLLLLVVDGQTGLLPADRMAIKIIRQSNRPALLVINKIDNQKIEDSLGKEFYKSEFTMSLVSSKNGRGSGDLLDEIINILKPSADSASELTKPCLSIAIIGKPNTGKSSLLNSLVGHKRSIVTAIPYTTREAHDTMFSYRGNDVCLVDTAGLRKHVKIQLAYKKNKTLEKNSELKTLKAIQHSQVILLVIDISQPITVQDKKLADIILGSNKGLIIVANKSDLLKNSDETKLVSRLILKSFPYLDWVPILSVSAKTGYNVRKVIPTALAVQENRMKKIDSADLIAFQENIIRRKKPPLITALKNKPVKIMIDQCGSCPPIFKINVNLPGDLPQFYLRFIEKELRIKFGFSGTPIKLFFIKYRGKK